MKIIWASGVGDLSLTFNEFTKRYLNIDLEIHPGESILTLKESMKKDFNTRLSRKNNFTNFSFISQIRHAMHIYKKS